MMRLIAFFLLFATSSSFAQTAPYSHSGAVDTAINAEIAKQKIVGMASVVIDDGKIAWSKGYGFADREKKIPVDPAATQFRWASISKPVTAIAAFQLVEEGKLDLDADVRTYVPEFPDKGVKITSRQLLCHQGGIVHYTNGEVFKTKKTYADPHPFVDVVVALDNFKDSPLVNPPGTKYSYSTHGFILLSAVVERAGKEKFADQVRERIAEPLGMTSFQPDYHWQDIPNRAAGYLRDDNKVIERRSPKDDLDVSWKLGGGGYTSTATDLARFGIGLFDEKLVSEKTKALMWTVNKPSNPQGAKPYGYGFFATKSPGGVKVVGHDGSQAKTRTCLMIDPTGRKGIALMCNSEWADLTELAINLIDKIQ